MAKPGLQNITTSQSFQAWLDRTNEIVDIFNDEVLTASTVGDTAGTLGSPLTSTLIGTFNANTISAADELLTNEITPISGSNIVTVNAQIFAESPLQTAAVFRASSGGRTSYSSPSSTWNVGFQNTSTNSFLIGNGVSGTQFVLSTAGDLAVSGEITSTQFNGDLVGDVTGDVTGNLTGEATSATVLTTPRSFSIAGAVATGTAVNFNGSGNVTLNVTQQNDSVILGTHTVGQYVDSLVQGTGITITNNAGEGSTPTITNSDRGSDQNIFKNIASAGQDTIVAGSNNSTLTLVAGSGIGISTNAATNSITITNTRSSPPSQSAAIWNAGTSTVESVISPEKLRQVTKIFAEAYVAYNGTAVPSLVSQYGINAVFRTGAGDTRFTFSTPQPDTNYVIESHLQFVGNVPDARYQYWIISKSTTEFTVRWRFTTLFGADVDISVVCKRLS